MKGELIVEHEQLLRGHAEPQTVVHVDEIVAERHTVPHRMIPEVPARQVELAVRHQERTAADKIVRRLVGRNVGVPEQIEPRIVDEEIAGGAAEKRPLAACRDDGLVLQGQCGNPLRTPMGHDRPVVAGLRDQDDRPFAAFSLENTLAAQDETETL